MQPGPLLRVFLQYRFLYLGEQLFYRFLVPKNPHVKLFCKLLAYLVQSLPAISHRYNILFLTHLLGQLVRVASIENDDPG